jgi:peroxin-3
LQSSLRRRFEQNQEDCTFTVLAILPTATENILEALPVEQTLLQLQQQRDQKVAKSSGMSEVSGTDIASVPGSALEDDGRSLQSFPSGSYVHASQIVDSDGTKTPQRAKKSKTVLWSELKITCKWP